MVSVPKVFTKHWWRESHGATITVHVPNDKVTGEGHLIQAGVSVGEMVREGAENVF